MTKHFLSCFRARPSLPRHRQPTLHAKCSLHLKHSPINHGHKLLPHLVWWMPQSAFQIVPGTSLNPSRLVAGFIDAYPADTSICRLASASCCSAWKTILPAGPFFEAPAKNSFFCLQARSVFTQILCSRSIQNEYKLNGRQLQLDINAASAHKCNCFLSDGNVALWRLMERVAHQQTSLISNSFRGAMYFPVSKDRKITACLSCSRCAGFMLLLADLSPHKGWVATRGRKTN